MNLPIRIKTYDNHGHLHGRFDLTAKDIEDIESIIADIEDILRTEFEEIEGDIYDDDSMD